MTKHETPKERFIRERKEMIARAREENGLKFGDKHTLKDQILAKREKIEKKAANGKTAGKKAAKSKTADKS